MNAVKTQFEFMGGAKEYSSGGVSGDTLERGTIFSPDRVRLKKCSVSGFGCKLYRYGIIVPAMERADRNRRAVIGTRAKACATLILLACCPSASALDPSLDINQYAHNAWPAREGSFKGLINAIAQTPDGYLWLGTEFGLLRFDGVRTVPWQQPPGERLPGSDVRSLLATRDGHLWIGTAQGLASWKGGKVSHYPELAGQVV